MNKDTTATEVNNEAETNPVRKPIILKIEELADIFGGSRCPPRNVLTAADDGGGLGGGGDDA